MHITRPTLRSDCKDGPRPCPWVSCRYHLAIEVIPRSTGGGYNVSIRNPPENWTDETKTCALDIADGGAITLKDIARISGVGRGEYERQIIQAALTKLRADPDAQDLAEIIGLDPDTKAPVLTSRDLVGFDETLGQKKTPPKGADPDFLTFREVERAFKKNPITVQQIKSIPVDIAYVQSVLDAIRKKQKPPRGHYVPRRKSKMMEQTPRTQQRKPTEAVNWIE
jgi:hypothetical protein